MLTGSSKPSKLPSLVRKTATMMAIFTIGFITTMVEQSARQLHVDISIGAGSLDLGAFLHEYLYNVQHELVFTHKRQSVSRMQLRSFV
jgi:hypothetical protein